MSQKVSPFPSGNHKAAITRRKAGQTQYRNNTNDPQKKYRLGAVSKIQKPIQKLKRIICV